MTIVRNCTKDQLRQWRQKTDERIVGIVNSPDMEISADADVYYVSACGNDDADGRSPDTPWKTLDKVNSAALPFGSVVRFRRGEVWRGQICAAAGVTYTAYGEGNKPKLYASPEDGADPAKWFPTEAENIWRYKGWEEDVGTIVFNHGEAHGIKCVLRREADGSTWNNTTGEPFASWQDLTTDLHFWHDLADGNIYLYSTENPGNRFSSIEFSIKRHGFITSGPEVTIDNFCVCYVGSHGVGTGTTQGLTVQNCEFHWIGGSIQSEGIFGRNYGTRYGNAVEIYGGCDRYTVRDCWFTQIYDAAVTQQFNIGDCERKPGESFSQKNILYKRNVMEYCNYSIEYFLSGVTPKNPSHIENFVIEDNYMWYAGRGFCTQRPDKGGGAHIKSWTSDNPATNYVIKNNLMVDTADMLVHISAKKEGPNGGDSMPRLENNHFAGKEGISFGILAFHSLTQQPYSPDVIAYLGEKSKGDTLWFIE
ncbi:MAG: hypothetical protein IIX84_07240 [Oscillospiraceae bacterium]|nr:hypothetical protein [Oscillospiraceae bacterium]